MNFSRQKFQDITQKENRVESLGCPSLELIDPTPDVFALFAQFNNRFFWGRLSSVSVRWSKRMYSCAGICRYRGREGFCEVALSEPLLKLRSRKNLIETLLHEMIHAYLFVTQNNTDRDGHGPVFHEHMYRINKEANINITVYHSFTDEVHLYKTHWWRCDGPCRDRKPFFGTVRRSSNRAPGPNDFWWKQHQQNCNGTFIKIKEPEKKQPKKKADPTKFVRKDIRNYFVTPMKIKTERKTDVSEPLSKKFKPNSSTSGNNTVIVDITGELNQPSTSKSKNNKPNRPSSSNSGNITKINTNVTKPPNRASSSNSGNNSKINTNITKQPNQPSPNNNVLDTVRNHWASKFVSPSPKNKPVKNNVSPISDSTLADYNKIIQDIYGPNVSLGAEDFKSESDENSFTKCPLCNISILNKESSDHISDCVDKSILEDEENMDNSNIVDESILEDEENVNNSNIVDKSTMLKNENKNDTNIVDLTILSSPDKSMVCCPVCNKKIHHDTVEIHLEDCLNNTFDDENNFVSKSDSKPTVNENLICLSDNDDETDVNEPGGSKRYPCPCCLNLIDENLMNLHLDTCVS